MQILHTMSRKLVYACFALILTVATKTEGINECITPTDERGVCINIMQCPFLLNLLPKNAKNAFVVSYLRSASCGYSLNVPKVCCPLENQTDEAIAYNFDGDTNEHVGAVLPSSPINTPNDNRQKYGDNKLEHDDFKENTSLHSVISRPITTDTTSTPTNAPLKAPESLSTVNSWTSSANTCGQSNSSKNLLTDGERVDLYDWPWIAKLGYRVLNNPSLPAEWLYHGTLIADRYVVTSASCTDKTSLKQLFAVRVGELNADESLPTDIPIERIMRHESYNVPNVAQNDIALLKLKHPVRFNEHVQPICLPTSPDLKSTSLEEMSVYFAGWSLGSAHGKQQNAITLKDLGIGVMTNAECQRIYANLVVIDKGIMCAENLSNGNNPCLADIGIPLVWLSEERYYLVGIVSKGHRRCVHPSYPEGYTRVTHFVDWIIEKIKNK